MATCESLSGVLLQHHRWPKLKHLIVNFLTKGCITQFAHVLAIEGTANRLTGLYVNCQESDSDGYLRLAEAVRQGACPSLSRDF